VTYFNETDDDKEKHCIDMIYNISDTQSDIVANIGNEMKKNPRDHPFFWMKMVEISIGSVLYGVVDNELGEKMKYFFDEMKKIGKGIYSGESAHENTWDKIDAILNNISDKDMFMIAFNNYENESMNIMHFLDMMEENTNVMTSLVSRERNVYRFRKLQLPGLVLDKISSYMMDTCVIITDYLTDDHYYRNIVLTFMVPSRYDVNRVYEVLGRYIKANMDKFEGWFKTVIYPLEYKMLEIYTEIQMKHPGLDLYFKEISPVETDQDRSYYDKWSKDRLLKFKEYIGKLSDEKVAELLLSKYDNGTDFSYNGRLLNVTKVRNIYI